jgi:hypothetical protein
MPKLELSMAFVDAAALNDEIEKNLRRARAFLVGLGGVAMGTPVTLVLLHPTTGRALRLEAEVVYVREEEPGRGVGLQLKPFDASMVLTMHAFADEVSGPAGGDLLDDLGPAVDDFPLPELPTEADDFASESSDDNDPVNVSLQARIRGLSLTEQMRVAKSGTLPERIALERIFGPAVWEALLSNNRLTQPEVARIAKKGTVSKPLIEIIAANGTWMASAEVQRALLSNPRVPGSTILKVLHALSRRDLQAAVKQTAYPAAVRQIAKRLLKPEP